MKTAITLLVLLGLTSCTGPAPLYTVTRTVSPPPSISEKAGFAPHDITGMQLVIDETKGEIIASPLYEEIQKNFNDDWTQVKPNAKWRKLETYSPLTIMEFDNGSQCTIERVLNDPPHFAWDIPVMDKSSTTYTKTGENTAKITTEYIESHTIDQGGPITYELVFTSPNRGYIKPYVAWGGIAPYAIRNLTFSLDTSTDPTQRLRTLIKKTTALTLETDIPYSHTKDNRRALPEQQAQTVKTILSRMKYRPASSETFGTDRLWNLTLTNKKGEPLYILPSTSLGSHGSLQFADTDDERTFHSIIGKLYDRIKYTTEEAMHLQPFTAAGHLSYDEKNHMLDLRHVTLSQDEQPRQYSYPGQHIILTSPLPPHLQRELERQPPHGNTHILHIRFDGHYQENRLIIDKIHYTAPAERQYLQSIGA
ncbi:WG repeat-containing protein [Akkermansia glycaniphila]|uniref:WG repeat-containing protein n=1 Tax=Akkermansia glycaniphila TaxID=1679444 RepID=UPI001C027596|nr:WG repeat-containing protein [Akkermansia glycaniphila]MBT9450378.1 WG repeat-containing protein [Akkermansia glycaniphila]